MTCRCRQQARHPSKSRSPFVSPLRSSRLPPSDVLTPVPPRHSGGPRSSLTVLLWTLLWTVDLGASWIHVSLAGRHAPIHTCHAPRFTSSGARFTLGFTASSCPWGGPSLDFASARRDGRDQPTLAHGASLVSFPCERVFDSDSGLVTRDSSSSSTSTTPVRVRVPLRFPPSFLAPPSL